MKHVYNTALPKARTEKLIIKDITDETLVYDLERDKAHCLNRTAALVWKYCDGTNDVSQMRALLESEIGVTVPEDAVLVALDQLQQCKLIEKSPELTFALSGMNRRDLIRRIGTVAFVLPVILAITVPTAAQTGSAGQAGHCCGSPTDCNPGLTCQQQPTCITPPPAAPSTKACV